MNSSRAGLELKKGPGIGQKRYSVYSVRGVGWFRAFASRAFAFLFCPSVGHIRAVGRINVPRIRILGPCLDAAHREKSRYARWPAACKSPCFQPIPG